MHDGVAANAFRMWENDLVAWVFLCSFHGNVCLSLFFLILRSAICSAGHFVDGDEMYAIISLG